MEATPWRLMTVMIDFPGSRLRTSQREQDSVMGLKQSVTAIPILYLLKNNVNSIPTSF